MADRTRSAFASVALAFGAAAFVPSSALADEPASPPPAPAKKDDVADVVIVGTKSTRLAGSAYVLKSDQLRRFANDDPHKVMLQVPGVYVRGEDGFGLRPNIGMRGANPDRSKKVTLMEDGVLLGPAPYSAPAAYYFPLIGRMETVRVFKGPGALVYGPQTVGGAVDLVTRTIPTTGPVASLDLGWGSYAYRKVDAVAGWGNERFGFVLQGTLLGSDGFKHVDGSNESTGFSRSEWMAKARFVPFADDRAQNTFELKLGWSDETSHESYLGLTDADFRADPDRRYAASAGDVMRWTRTQLEITHRARLARTLDVVTTFYAHGFARTWDRFQDLSFASTADVLANPRSNQLGYDLLRGAVDSPTNAQAIVRGPNDRRFYSTGLQTTLRWAPRIGPVANKIELGFRIHADGITRLHGRTDYLVVGGRLVPAPRASYLEADNDASAVAVSMHLVDAVTWKRFTVTPGVRIESIRSRLVDRLAGTTSSGFDLVVLPGVSAFAGLTPDFGFLAGVYRGFSPAAPGDPAQNHESSVDWEAGARWASKGFRADLIGFYNDYSNITSVCSESSGCLPTNVDRQLSGGSARIVGAEAFVEAAPKLGRGLTLPMRAAYTFTWAEFLHDFVASDPTWGRVRAGDEMPYVPLHQLYAQLGIEGPRFGLNVAGTYVGDMRERPGQGDVTESDLTDPYFLLDVGASWKPRRWLTLSFQVRNLLDERPLVARLPFGARPGAPRTMLLGMRIEL